MKTKFNPSRKSSRFKKQSEEEQAEEYSSSFDWKLWEEINNIVDKRIRSYVRWTESAEVELSKISDAAERQPFCAVLKNKIQKSLAGAFIRDFNQCQRITRKEQEDKLFVSKFTVAQNEFPACYLRENDYVEDLMHIIESLVLDDRKGDITLKKFLRSLTHLRLSFAKIGEIEKPLHFLSGLKLLSLSANYIERIPFRWLPLQLQFLELSGNMIHEINDTENGPPLLYLGLSYNIITDRSRLSGLSPLKHLVYLDLSDNDLCQLDDLLLYLNYLPFLNSLSLKGNPCSVTTGYTLNVLKGLPKLLYLDGESTNKFHYDEEKTDTVDNNFMKFAILKISVFRIMGLTKPKVAKGVRGFYEVEVELPLLDDILRDNLRQKVREELLVAHAPAFTASCEILPESSVHSQILEMESTPVEKTNKHLVENNAVLAGLHTNQINDFQDKSKRLPQSDSPWKVAYEKFLAKDASIEGVTKITSSKLTWNTIIKPKNPLFEIVVEPKNIVNLRDTLRSIITLRVYYSEVTAKKKDKQSERTLVAKVPIPAEVPLWYEDYKGYVWTAKDHCISKPYPGIAEIVFAVGGKGMKTNDDQRAAVFPPPNYLTCHVGISLNRFKY